MSIFVDTSAFLSLLDAGDADHEAVKSSWVDLVRGNAVLWCTSYILVETCALIQARLGLDALRVFDEDVLPVVDVHWVQETEHAVGMAAVLTANRKRLSLVDCVSFAVMRQLGVDRALTLDEHFQEQGFDVIPARPRP